MSLYLDTAPLSCTELTGSMIRNYVKTNPVQRRYYAEHLVHLIAIALCNIIYLNPCFRQLSIQDIETG